MAKSYELLPNGPVFIIPPNEKFSKAERLEYINICENIWGVVPLDISWAKETKIYQDYKKQHYATNS